MQNVADAMRRATAVLERRPSAGMHDDAPAVAHWIQGLQIETRHSGGRTVLTDMPRELGGGGDQVSPGWMVRAGVAACTATTIAAISAERGLELTRLEVQVTSRTDTRGYLGMHEAEGGPVYAGPDGLCMTVCIAARDATDAALRAIVHTARDRAPMMGLVQSAMEMNMAIEIVRA